MLANFPAGCLVPRWRVTIMFCWSLLAEMVYVRWAASGVPERSADAVSRVVGFPSALPDSPAPARRVRRARELPRHSAGGFILIRSRTESPGAWHSGAVTPLLKLLPDGPVVSRRQFIRFKWDD